MDHIMARFLKGILKHLKLVTTHLEVLQMTLSRSTLAQTMEQLRILLL
jgi:hypothetical protein